MLEICILIKITIWWRLEAELIDRQIEVIFAQLYKF